MRIAAWLSAALLLPATGPQPSSNVILVVSKKTAPFPERNRNATVSGAVPVTAA